MRDALRQPHQQHPGLPWTASATAAARRAAARPPVQTGSRRLSCLARARPPQQASLHAPPCGDTYWRGRNPVDVISRACLDTCMSDEISYCQKTSMLFPHRMSAASTRWKGAPRSSARRQVTQNVVQQRVRRLRSRRVCPHAGRRACCGATAMLTEHTSSEPACDTIYLLAVSYTAAWLARYACMMRTGTRMPSEWEDAEILRSSASSASGIQQQQSWPAIGYEAHFIQGHAVP